jgi:proline iminopeptidase
MGGGRAGWYSWDWLDNSGQPSADHIVPEWQSLEVGRQLKGPANWWTVAVVEPNRTLVLQSSCGLPPGHCSDPRPGSLPRAHLDGIWGFHVRSAPGGRTGW